MKPTLQFISLIYRYKRNTEPVLLKMENSPQNIRGYTDIFFSAVASAAVLYHTERLRKMFDVKIIRLALAKVTELACMPSSQSNDFKDINLNVI